MRLLYLTLLSIFLSSGLSAQHVLSGKVTDSKSGDPIADVIVYLDGTSFNTKTNSEGYFMLNVTEKTKSNLIFSHVGYRIAATPDPFNRATCDAALNPKKVVLDEITVEGNKKQKRAFDYDRRKEAFKSLFLGTTDAGKSCEIQNWDDITLFYDADQKILSAYADKPIHFTNKYLGYTVYFLLLDFKAHYYPDANSLNEFNSGESYFSGITLFNDDIPNDQRINNNRVLTFSQSPTYFFRNLVHDRLYEHTGFRVFSAGAVLNPNDYFDIIDTMDKKLVVIRPEQVEVFKQQGKKNLPKGVCASLFVNIGGAIETPASRGFSDSTAEYDLTNLRRPTQVEEKIDMKSLSTMYFYTDKFFVDYYGNVENPNAIRFAGALGQLKAGDMLPDNYRPRSRADVREAKKEIAVADKNPTKEEDSAKE